MSLCTDFSAGSRPGDGYHCTWGLYNVCMYHTPECGFVVAVTVAVAVQLAKTAN